ncbi:MAG: hypothetical protein JEZ07_16715 [Phycisphaerae bacterium]|nr:hypothetical protein [Phycisphaerae bacterium]
MNFRNKFIWFAIMLVTTAWLVPTASAEPTFLVDSFQEWEMLLFGQEGQNMVSPTGVEQLHDQRMFWERNLADGKAPDFGELLPADLYVFEGDDNPEYPDEPCLIMAWGGPDVLPDFTATAGWDFVYGIDPDLSNCTISLIVHPPPAIVNVSFGLKDINGAQVSWSWTNPADIPSSPPSTTITINTNDIPTMGMTAPNPSASGYAITPGFDITQVVSFFINETFHSTPGTFPTPPPGAGSTTKLYWNAWDEFKVVPNTGPGPGPAVNSKWFVKYSQPPVITDDNMIYGWDELSLFKRPPFMADDWECTDKRPITDIHWWGSFLGWTQPYPPPGQMPKGFHIGIWTDVPKDATGNFSHPGVMIWENYCESSVWNFAGFDKDPRDPDLAIENEACFQFAQFLSQDQWFWQDPIGEDGTQGGRNVYWLSIAAYYGPNQEVQHPWGWKTRPHHFNDDAVRTYMVQNPDGTVWPNTVGADFMPYKIGAKWIEGEPVELNGESWDLAFELTTNAPGYEDNPIPGDLNLDKQVDIADFGIFAAHWLVGTGVIVP